MTRLLCTGDLHLGQGAGLYPERLQEQEQVWRSILELARAERVDAVLHAGDMWERRKPTPSEVLAAERPLVEHRAAGGPLMIVVAGNHDTAGTDPVLALHVLAEAGLLALSTRPETLNIFPAGVTVATLPWTPISRLVAQLGGGDRDLTHHDAARLLVDEARRLRSMVDGPCVLLGHWSVTGSALPSGLPVDELREVVLDLDELLGTGFDAVVLGHIHCAQGLGGEDAPPAMYVGSPMPLNHGEAGQEHGVWILDLDERTAEFRPITSARFATLELEPVDYLFTGLPCDVDGLIVRCRLTLPANHSFDTDALRAAVLDAGARHVTIDVSVDRPSRSRVDVDETVTVTDAFEGWLTATGRNDDADRLRRLHREIEEAVA